MVASAGVERSGERQAKERQNGEGKEKEYFFKWAFWLFPIKNRKLNKFKGGLKCLVQSSKED